MKPLDFDVKLGMEELERFTEWKKRELFKAMEADYDLVMAHFHKADHIHHWFWEVGKMDKVEETYHEMDELAAEIKEKAEEEGFDTVLFISDHGLPDIENGGHNENAFYSCNRELFGEEVAHITDFHDKILELVMVEDTTEIEV
jgi:2,3-bisphosphoglycerate-independent phosphoglycerate mutase